MVSIILAVLKEFNGTITKADGSTAPATPETIAAGDAVLLKLIREATAGAPFLAKMGATDTYILGLGKALVSDMENYEALTNL